MLTQDEILTAVSSTAFVSTSRYNQHKINVPQKGFKALMKTGGRNMLAYLK